jgi:hypothetical protein
LILDCVIENGNPADSTLVKEEHRTPEGDLRSRSPASELRWWLRLEGELEERERSSA